MPGTGWIARLAKIGVFPVQMRDPVSVNKVEYNQGRHLRSASGLHIHVHTIHTFAHTCKHAYTPIHHTHTDHSWPHCKLKASLGCLRPCLKDKKQTRKKPLSPWVLILSLPLVCWFYSGRNSLSWGDSVPPQVSCPVEHTRKISFLRLYGLINC